MLVPLFQRVMERLQERGVRQGFQLILSFGDPLFPLARLWAIKPPRGLGESTAIVLEGSCSLKEALGRIFIELEIEEWSSLLAAARSLQLALGIERFQASFSFLPGCHGPKLWVSAPGISFVSGREDLDEALVEVLRQIEDLKAASS